MGCLSLQVILVNLLFLLCNSLDINPVQEIRENVMVPLLLRSRKHLEESVRKWLTFSNGSLDIQCPCTFNNDSSVREDLVSFDHFVKACTKQINEVKMASFNDGKGFITEGVETVRSIKQQIKFLIKRINHVKQLVETESMKQQALQENVVKLQLQPILLLAKHLKLKDNIRSSDPRGPRKQSYSILVEQNRRRKTLARRVSKIDICVFQKQFCTIQDIATVDDDSYVVTVTGKRILFHKHLNGTTLGTWESVSDLKGLIRLRPGNNVVVGVPKLQMAIILKMTPFISIVRDVKFDDLCPLGITQVKDKIVVACQSSIRLYDKYFNLESKFEAHNMATGIGEPTWLTFNPVSRLVLFSNANTKILKGISLDGDIIFSKKSSWFPLKNPAGAVVASNGDVFVSDRYQKRIAKFAVTGTFLGHIHKTISNSVDMIRNNTLLVGSHLSSVSVYRLL